MISPQVKVILWAFTFGVATGALMAISLKYPVSEKVIAEANNVCIPNHGFEKMRVGLSGKVYFVQCKNGKKLDLK